MEDEDLGKRISPVQIGELFYILDTCDLSAGGDRTAKVDCQTYWDENDNYPNLLSVTIPEKVVYDDEEYRVVSISHAAFAFCSRLTSVDLPKTLCKIEEAAFWGCGNLTSIVVPDGISVIEKNAFYDCPKLLVKGDLWSIKVVEFSPEGKLLQVERKGESKDTYTYSKNQKTTTRFSADNTLINRIVTNYTKWGAIKTIVYYNASGIETGRVDYTYDAKRQLVERLHQSIANPYTKEENIQFDAAGHEIRCERYDKENRLKEIEANTYDADGRKILNEVSRYEGGAYAYGGSSRYTYNQEGFISMVESATDMGEYQVTHMITYVYDTQGNYVTKNNMYDWWPSVEERTILYY